MRSLMSTSETMDFFDVSFIDEKYYCYQFHCPIVYTSNTINLGNNVEFHSGETFSIKIPQIAFGQDINYFQVQYCDEIMKSSVLIIILTNTFLNYTKYILTGISIVCLSTMVLSQSYFFKHNNAERWSEYSTGIFSIGDSLLLLGFGQNHDDLIQSKAKPQIHYYNQSTGELLDEFMFFDSEFDTFTNWKGRKEKLSPFEQLLDLFKQMLLYTSDDVCVCV